MLADTFDGYRNLEQRLVTEFLRCCALPLSPEVVNKLNDGIVHWLERRHPRKYVVPSFCLIFLYSSLLSIIRQKAKISMFYAIFTNKKLICPVTSSDICVVALLVTIHTYEFRNLLSLC